MSKSKPLTPDQAVHMVGNELRKLGLRQVKVSETGSRYYKIAGLPFELRVSDHRYSGYTRRRNVHVTLDVVLGPLPGRDLAAFALDAGVKFVASINCRTVYLR